MLLFSRICRMQGHVLQGASDWVETRLFMFSSCLSCDVCWVSYCFNCKIIFASTYFFKKPYKNLNFTFYFTSWNWKCPCLGQSSTFQNSFTGKQIKAYRLQTDLTSTFRSPRLFIWELIGFNVQSLGCRNRNYYWFRSILPRVAE